MLTWNGKKRFIGLMDRIGNAGVMLYDDSEGEHCTDELLAQAIIDSYTLADAQAEVCARIAAHATQLRDAAVAGISPGEMAAWPIKRAESAAYVTSGDPANAPLLSAESMARGVSLAVMIDKVDGNAIRLATLEALIAGTDGRHRDAVRSLTTFEAVSAYNWTQGWPEL